MRKTLQDELQDSGAIGIPLRLPCPCCRTIRDVGAIVEALPADGIEAEWTCATGLLDRVRATTLAQEAAQLALPQTWSSSRGADVRAQRLSRLIQTDHLVQPDYPLTDVQRAVVSAYRQALRDITDTYSGPDEVVWPAEPLGVQKGA